MIDSTRSNKSSGTSTVLAVGAAGTCARLVVPELAKRGAHVRALIRDARHEETVRKNGAAEVVVADLADDVSIASALKGVAAVSTSPQRSCPMKRPSV